MAGWFEVYEDRAGMYRFRLRAANWQIVAVGEAYETRAAVLKACEQVKEAADGATITVEGEDTPVDTGSAATRWLVYKHPDESPLVVVAERWDTIHDGTLLRFYSEPGDVPVSVAAVFSIGAVFGFVREDKAVRS